MALRDPWHRTLVYFGLAEEDDGYRDEVEPEPEEEINDRYRDRPNVRRLQNRRSRRDENHDIFADEAPPTRRQTRGPRPGGNCGRGAGPGPPLDPDSFNAPPHGARPLKDPVPGIP